MTGAFKYLSPREFHKLSAARKERYLAALFENLHPEHKPVQRGAEETREPNQDSAQGSKELK